MKSLKSAIVALTMALSFGLFSTSALAVSPQQVVDMIQGKIAEASKAIDDGASADDVLKLIGQAKSLSKEINANDLAAAKTQRAVAPLKTASKLVKDGKLEKAKADLAKSEKRWEDVRDAF